MLLAFRHVHRGKLSRSYVKEGVPLDAIQVRRT